MVLHIKELKRRKAGTNTSKSRAQPLPDWRQSGKISFWWVKWRMTKLGFVLLCFALVFDSQKCFRSAQEAKFMPRVRESLLMRKAVI